MSFCNLIKGNTPKICMLYFVLINNVLLNLLCVCITACLDPSTACGQLVGFEYNCSDIAGKSGNGQTLIPFMIVGAMYDPRIKLTRKSKKKSKKIKRERERIDRKCNKHPNS